MAYGRVFSFGSNGGKPRATVLGNFRNIVDHFNKAKSKMSRPTMRLLVDNVIFHISCAGPESKNHGYLYVRRGNDYLGKIAPNGDYFALSMSFTNAIEKINQDPIAMAVLYGKETNSCSFCGRELSDARSVHFGYGPICAANHGLPWDEEVPSNKHEEILTDLADMLQDNSEYDLPALAVCSKQLEAFCKKPPFTPGEMASTILHTIKDILEQRQGVEFILQPAGRLQGAVTQLLTDHQIRKE